MSWNAKKSGAASGGKLDTQGLAGIGDEAFLIHGKALGGGSSTTLFVRKGTSDFNVQANGLKSEPIAAVKDVAKKIVDRL